MKKIEDNLLLATETIDALNITDEEIIVASAYTFEVSIQVTWKCFLRIKPKNVEIHERRRVWKHGEVKLVALKD